MIEYIQNKDGVIIIMVYVLLELNVWAVPGGNSNTRLTRDEGVDEGGASSLALHQVPKISLKFWLSDGERIRF